MSKKPTPSLDTVPLISDLGKKLKQLRQEAFGIEISLRNRKVLEAEIREVIQDLGGLLSDLDRIKQPSAMFDPSNPKIVGRFVSLALVAQPRQPMSEIPRFYGSGVYAIYYNGEHSLYAPLSKSETPIYVGQAAPTVSNARTPSEQGDKLSRRLDEHRKNILRAKSTLDVNDFEFRALVVQSGWETAAEEYLIHLFRPIWNSQTNLVFGLGKHGDSANTRANKRSPWDTLHPGRTWAADSRLQDAKNQTQLKSDLVEHFKKHPVFHGLDGLLLNFIDELKQI